MKGKKAQLGEIREWSGKKMQKTTTGWVPAGAGKGKEAKMEGKKDILDKFLSKELSLNELKSEALKMNPHDKDSTHHKLYENEVEDYISRIKSGEDKDSINDFQEFLEGKKENKKSDSKKSKLKAFITLKTDNDMPSSMWALQGKLLKVKGTKEHEFSTGPQTYYIVEGPNGDVEVPERFTKSDDKKKVDEGSDVGDKLTGIHKVVYKGDFATIKVKYDDLEENYSYSGKTKDGASISGTNVSEEKIKGIIEGKYQNKS